MGQWQKRGDVMTVVMLFLFFYFYLVQPWDCESRPAALILTKDYVWESLPNRTS